ncbi:MAG: 2-hydroxychromene-2-carboxylate isomerase [Gammaproteobacteria bacterium]|nr:2-hydroxychromene-2-carboxylate isomerase [Gammaproteobacteria bacterium]MBT3859058.1 2-hydroxychromene-2-carboxylate isomerase [Gammaproteobacteria bacterium]MBT3987058.1 2-hydroxychromene-2-carboxylate isomerase [Gammaproteobacteria bacterium]MBT4254600.1 2-hydroxychromene-2-carboxylate isomerase [Gammaproteobacteria bacterium]MBT4580677.1 2-hydroxychromene-2-carboxylate isomerase [Gammaproteobacteria bacterium]
MEKTIDYYLSLISPWSYLGHQRLISMAKEHDVGINIFPIDFSLVFPSTGGIPLPKRSPQRKAYRMQELIRWRDHLNIPLNLEPAFFPTNDKLAASMIVKLRESDADAAVNLAFACLRACWNEEKDISDRDTLLQLATDNQLDGESLLVDIDESLALIASDSEDAVQKGIFGAPSYALGEQIFWGQDRLEFLDRALAQRRLG